MNKAAIKDVKQKVEALLSTIKESTSEIEDIYENKIDLLESELSDVREENEMLEGKTSHSLPVKSVLDETKFPIIQRLWQNLNIEQLEEVENFARSIVKHPSKYIEFIHEN